MIKGDVQGSIESSSARWKDFHRRSRRAQNLRRRRRHHRIRRNVAEAFGRGLIGFNVRAHKKRREPAEQAASRSATITSSTTGRRREEGDVGPARADAAREHARQRASFSKSSRSRRSATSPAAASPTASSSAAPMFGSFATTSSFTKASCRSSSASRTMRAKSSRPGMRHGIEKIRNEGRRHNRVLPGGERTAIAVSPSLQPSCAGFDAGPAPAFSGNRKLKAEMAGPIPVTTNKK